VKLNAKRFYEVNYASVFRNGIIMDLGGGLYHNPPLTGEGTKVFAGRA